VSTGWFSETVALDEPVPTLAEFYRGRLTLVAEPGTTFNYTDHNFATLGQIVEDVTGTALHVYYREQILEPLGMVDSDLLRSERVRSRLATGYKLGPGGPHAVVDRVGVAAAAGMIYSTPRDVARYVAALLGGGSGEHGQILKPETVALMFEPHFQPDRRLSGVGLSFFRGDLGGHLAVEHQGIMPGFNSQIFLAPDDGVGVIGFANGARNAVIWLTAEMGRLLGDLLGVPDDVIRTDVPYHPEVWGDICGWYAPLAQRTVMRFLSMIGVGVEVRVRRGRLMLRALSPIPALLRGLELHPDDEHDPHVFRIDLSSYDLGTARVVFSPDRDGGTTRVHLDGVVPLSAERRPTWHNPMPWAAGAVGGLALAGAIKAMRRERTDAGG
jgi:CubicO group peptidase (beta-lactamase class C family)